MTSSLCLCLQEHRCVTPVEDGGQPDAEIFSRSAASQVTAHQRALQCRVRREARREALRIPTSNFHLEPSLGRWRPPSMRELASGVPPHNPKNVKHLLEVSGVAVGRVSHPGGS